MLSVTVSVGHVRRNRQNRAILHVPGTLQAMSEARSRGIEVNSTYSRYDQDVALIGCIMTCPPIHLLVARSCRSHEPSSVLAECFPLLSGAFWQEEITSTNHHKSNGIPLHTPHRGPWSFSRLLAAVVVACGQAIRGLRPFSNSLVFCVCCLFFFSFSQSTDLERHSSNSLAVGVDFRTSHGVQNSVLTLNTP